MKLVSTNPATGEMVAEYTQHEPHEIDAVLKAVSDSFDGWRRTSFEHRSGLMHKLSSNLRERETELALLMAREMGKPRAQGVAEVRKCASVCDYYAENAQTFLERMPISSDARNSFVTFEPLGPVLAVMPWNFPLWQVFRFAAPALMAGNVGVLKHASNVTGCALAIEDLFRGAGFPEHAFRVLLANKDQIGKVIEDDRIQAVTLTGSVAAGRAIAAQAGGVIKKTVLELGGSDPYVILADADIDAATQACVTSRLINTGQSCIAAKRFVVVASVLDRFTDAFVERMRAKRIGDPVKDEVDLGPMARVDLRDELHDQVQRSVAAGAQCILGGERPAGAGAFYPATVLTDVAPGMVAYAEELFGPVASIIAANDEDDAVRIANDSCFGLGAAVFTRDVQKGERIAATRLSAGCCFVNDFVRSDPRLPFGGIKQSGYGRELGSFGIREFVNTKTVYIA